MIRPVRVLSIINELYFGGDENRLLAMARTVDRARLEQIVVTLKRPNPRLDPYFGTMRAQYAAAGVPVLDLGEGHPNEGLAPNSVVRLARAAAMFARTVQKTCRLIREHNIDVIDAHLGPGNLVGVVAGALTNTPRAVTTYHVEQWSPSWLWYLVHQWTLAMADEIITDSQACADQIRRWMLGRGRSPSVVPNGVVVPTSARSVADLRREFGLPAGESTRIVGQISTLIETKGHAVLLDAARSVLERLPDTAFLIVGYVREDTTYKDRLQARAAALGIAGRVRIVSYPGPVGDVWKVIDVLAHPTTLDSLPNAIIEGMSLGRPAVVTNVGGIPTLVDDGVTGLVIAPNDSRALADALVRLLSDPAYAASLGDAARRRYLERYTPEIMSRSLEDIFTGLASKRRSVALRAASSRAV